MTRPYQPHRIAILAYEGCQLLDVTGPAAVFGAANEGRAQPVYDVQIVSPDGGAGGLQLRRRAAQPRRSAASPTPCWSPAARAASRPRWRTRACGAGCARWRPRPGATARSAPAPSCWRRPACSTASGWRRTGRAASVSPSASPPSRSMPTRSMSSTARSGPRPASPPASTWRWRWSRPISARRLANLIARHFVLYARRPGYQSQFSPMLQAQTAAETPFAALIDWMQAHLDQPLDVPALARPRRPVASAASIASSPRPRPRRRRISSRACALDAARTLLAEGPAAEGDRGQVGCAPRRGSARPSSAASAWRRRCSARCMPRPDLTFLPDSHYILSKAATWHAAFGIGNSDTRGGSEFSKCPTSGDIFRPARRQFG